MKIVDLGFLARQLKWPANSVNPLPIVNKHALTQFCHLAVSPFGLKLVQDCRKVGEIGTTRGAFSFTSSAFRRITPALSSTLSHVSLSSSLTSSRSLVAQ
jgi:hypothetical protein